MKNPSAMSRAELLAELALQRASTDVAWAIATSLVEKIAQLEKQCAMSQVRDLKKEQKRWLP